MFDTLTFAKTIESINFGAVVIAQAMRLSKKGITPKYLFLGKREYNLILQNSNYFSLCHFDENNNMYFVTLRLIKCEETTLAVVSG